jgi:hypothetical protein
MNIQEPSVGRLCAGDAVGAGGIQVLSSREGVSVLPRLEQEAERLGAQGHYPYAALGYAAMQTALQDWGTDNQHAIRVLSPLHKTRRMNCTTGCGVDLTWQTA